MRCIMCFCVCVCALRGHIYVCVCMYFVVRLQQAAAVCFSSGSRTFKGRRRAQRMRTNLRSFLQRLPLGEKGHRLWEGGQSDLRGLTWRGRADEMSDEREP